MCAGIKRFTAPVWHSIQSIATWSKLTRRKSWDCCQKRHRSSKSRCSATRAPGSRRCCHCRRRMDYRCSWRRSPQGRLQGGAGRMSEHRISVNVASRMQRADCTMPRCAQDTWAASRAGLTCGRPRRQKHQEGDNVESHGIHIDLRCADGAAGGRRAQSPGPRRRRDDYVCRNSLLPVERKKGDKLNFAGKSRARAPLFRSFFTASCLH